jgi:hypothetical protein
MKKLFTLCVVLLAMLSSANLKAGTFSGGFVKDTLFTPNPGYFYAIIGLNASEGSWPADTYMHFAYVKNAGVYVEAPSDTTAAKYMWSIDSTTTTGKYTLKNVVTGLYIDGISASTEYAIASCSATQGLFSINDLRKATNKTAPLYTCATSGKSYAAYQPFQLLYSTNRTLTKANFWRKLALSRSDAVTFLYGVSKSSVYTGLLNTAIANAQTVAARTVAEGTGLLEYKAGVKAGLNTAIADAQTALTGGAWATMATALATLNAAVDTFKVNVNVPEGKYNLMSGSKYVALLNESTLTLAGTADSVALLNGSKNSAGKIILMSGTNYVQPAGTLTTTATAYEPIVDNGTVTLVSGTDTVKINGASAFTMSVVATPMKPELQSLSPANGATAADTSDISITFDQNIMVVDAAKITINGEQATYSVTEKVLTITNPMTIKTQYTVIVDKGAIANKNDAALVADSIGFSFTTFSPYWRDKVTMLGAGTLTAGTAYALFIRGGTSGYMQGGQISCSTTDTLNTTLANVDRSFWIPVLTDTVNKVWNFKNYESSKYLGFRMSDSSLVVSETPVGWQMSLIGSNATYNWQNNYAFWPSVADTDGAYDFVVNPATLKIVKLTAAATATNCICPIVSPVSAANTQVYNPDYYVTLNARAGYQFYQDGSTLVYGTPTDVTYGQWKYVRLSNGRYTFQNRATGDYMTCVNDTVASVLPESSTGSKEWGMIYNSTQNSTTYWYNAWSNKYAVIGKYGLTPSAVMSSYNGGNSSSTGAAMVRPVLTSVTLIVGGGQPVVSVPSVSASSINLSWTENEEAANYIVRLTDTLSYSNGDSIGVDNLGNKIYEQIPYITDSLCASIDTIAALEFKETNLDANVKYWFTVTPVSASGLIGTTSAIGNAETVGLDKFVPAAPSVGTITMKTVALSWIENEEAVSYTISYWTKADSSDMKQITDTHTSCVIPNLLANTTVYACLRINGIALVVSNPSEIVNATTLAYSTLVANLPTATVLSDTSASITWNPFVDAVSYHLYITSTASKLTTVAAVDVSDTTLVKGGLSSYTTYYYQVASVDVNGVESKRSTAKTFRTLTVSLDKTPQTKISVLTEASSIRVLHAKEQMVSVYSITGKKICSQYLTSDDECLNMAFSQGLYLIRVNSMTVKALVR